MNIAKNTFYRKYDITTDGLIELHALYKDVPIYNTDANFKIQGKANANRYVVSGQVSAPPPQGSAELTAGFLNLYVSGTDVSSTTTLPQLSLYKIKDNDITMKEGGMTLASTGDNAETDDKPATPGQVRLYTTYVGNMVPYLSEDFSGRTLGDDVIGASDGSTLLTQAEPYLNPEDDDVVKALFLGGTASYFAGDSEVGDMTSSQILRRFFSTQQQTDGSWRLPIRPKNKSKKEGLWKNKLDLREGAEMYSTYPPFWRWDHIKSLVQYGRVASAPKPPDDEGGAETDPTPNNTIFREMYRTPNNSDAAESGKDENSAWAVSDLKISSSKSKTGGSSLRMYHMWNFSKDNQESDKLFGTAGGANSQVTCAYTEAIPFPVPIDHTYSSDYDLCTAASGQTHISQVKPEINLTFAITQMDTRLKWHNSMSQSDTKSGSSWTLSNVPNFMKFKSYCAAGVGPSGTGGYNKEFAFNDHGWLNGEIKPALIDQYDPRLAGAGYHTLLRNFTVTLSNYAPTKGQSLDDFLNTGLDSFYSGTNNSVVGGFTVFRTINNATDTDEYEGPKLTAVPLLTRPSHWIASGNSGTGWDNGQLTRGLPFFATSGATGESANLFINGAFKVGYTQSGPEDGNPAEFYESSVELPMDDFIDVKIMFDTTARNGWGFDTDGDEFFDYNQAGRTSDVGMCKAFFVTPTTSGNMTATGDPSVYVDKVPSIPIYFPAQSGSAKVWNWEQNPERWPRILTVWTTNYRFSSVEETLFASGSNWTGDTGGAGSGLTTGTVAAPDGDGTFTNVSVAGYGLRGDFPIAPAVSGNGKKTEVWLDRIELNNFGPEVFNNSSNQGIFTMPMGIKNVPVRTPMGDRTSGSMGPPNERGDAWFQRIGPTYVTMGFDDVATIPNTNGSAGTRYGWLMWNGFSQNNFQPNMQNQLSTLQAWKSMVSGSSGVTAAEAKFVNYYGGQCKSVGQLWYGETSAAAAVTAGYQVPATKQGLEVKIDSTAATGDGSEVDKLYFETGDNAVLSNDGLSQKGTSYMSIKTADWKARENIFVSGRVLDVPSITPKSNKTHDYNNENWDLPANSVVVSNPSLFEVGDAAAGPYYMMWLYGTAGASDAEMTSAAAVAGKRSAHLTIKSVEDSLITFNEPLPAIATDENLPRLFIGPVKHWITMQIFNGPTSSAASAGSYQTYVSGTKSGDKAYDNIAILGTLSGSTTTPAETMTGSTWNESTYYYNSALEATGGRSATYGKKWNLDADPEGNLELEIDYGHGAYDEEERKGGQLDVKTAYVGEMLHMDIKGLVDNGEEDGNDFKLVLGLKNPMAQQKVEITSPDSGPTATPSITAIDKAILRPHFLWGYKVKVPTIRNLSVSPLFNMLEEGTNLYESTNQDLRAVKFTWEEDSEDIWYRMLMIDVSGNTIKNKYHNASMVVKGNEAPLTPAAKPVTKVYDYSVTPATESGTTVGDDVRAPITGLQGYTIQTASSSTAADGVIAIPYATNSGWDDLQEWTFVTHLIPSSDDSGHDAYFLTHGTDIEMYIEGDDGSIKFNMGGDTRLQSLTKVAYDGETPMSVIITYNNTATDGKYIKLYIDGVLEDTSTHAATIETNNVTTIGGKTTPAAASCYRGKIEEIILYNKSYDIPDKSGEYIFKASNVDSTKGNSIDKKIGTQEFLVHSAKLFAYDYTNIRGTTVQEVGSSKQVGWKVTSV